MVKFIYLSCKIYIKLMIKCILKLKIPQLEINQKHFISYINQTWPKNNSSVSASYILVEGALIAGGPNYLFRLASLANLISSQIRTSQPLVLFNQYECFQKNEILLLKAFDINHFVFTKKFFLTLPTIIKSFYDALIMFRRYVNKNESISALTYNGILVGDCIYDDIIREEKHTISVDKIQKQHFRFFFNIVYYTNCYFKILKKYPCSHSIVTHTQYGEYSLLARVAYQNNIPVFETTDMCLLYSDPSSDKEKIPYPSYHASLRKIIRLKIEKETINELTLHNSLNNLKQRHSGLNNQYDLRLAYHNKKLYTDIELRQELSIQNQKPFIFIMAHVFSDAPLTIGDGMLFDDYYKWLMSTINEATKNKEINWIIKPHPASSVYNEHGIIKEKLSHMHSDNIFLCPDDFNTSSIKDLALAIITARGTAGLEYSCLGIPTILAGKTFYSGFGFTIEPESLEGYYSTIAKAHILTPLIPSQIKTALHVYSIFVNYSSLENDPIITPDLLGYTWGVNGYEKNLDLSYQILLSNIKKRGLDAWTHLSLAKGFLPDLRNNEK